MDNERNREFLLALLELAKAVIVAEKKITGLFKKKSKTTSKTE